jgi:hypothetical protein
MDNVIPGRRIMTVIEYLYQLEKERLLSEFTDGPARQPADDLHNSNV